MDLLTMAGSILDPEISLATAAFQAPTPARQRNLTEAHSNALIAKHAEARQIDFLGEPRINVLELNFDLDTVRPIH